MRYSTKCHNSRHKTFSAIKWWANKIQEFQRLTKYANFLTLLIQRSEGATPSTCDFLCRATFTRPKILQMCLTKVFLVSLCYFVHCKNTRDAFVPSIQRMIDLVWRSKKRTDAALTKVDIVPCFTDSRQPGSCPSVFSHPTSHPHTLFVKRRCCKRHFPKVCAGQRHTTTEGSSLAVNVPLMSYS